MNRLVFGFTALLLAVSAVAAAPGKTLVTGLKNPESIAVSSDGRTFVSLIGEFDKDGDGSVGLLKGDKVEPFAEGFDDPKGLVAYQQWLFVADKTRVRRINLKSGKADIYADTKDFPIPPLFLNDLAIDEEGNLYISDSGDRKGGGGAIFRIAGNFPKRPKPGEPLKKYDPDAPRVVTVVAEAKTAPYLKTPNGLLLDSQFHLLVVDFASGDLHRLKLADGTVEKVADGFKGGDGLCFDQNGRLYITSWSEGKVWSIPRPGEKPVLMAEGFKSAADLCLDNANDQQLLVPDMLAGTITALPSQPPGWEVDRSPLPIETAVAFKDMTWTGWDSGADSGKRIPLRPILLTNAADGLGRIFVATQQGVLHAFKDGDKETKVVLDIQKKVFYDDKENEQGLLGLAFHPKFKENGEVYIFYTLKEPRLTNVISRFRISKTNPDQLDPASEEEVMRINHKYWNHDGGTICFGPDGFLYVVLGDGGDGGDPDDHGQMMSTLLGKILRIDVNSKAEGKAYGIPKDNPFAATKGAAPEIFALGVRNPWRMSFDRKTGQGWFADVGQNLWEEINLLEKGGNYGWRRRESLHPYHTDGTGPKKELIEPIWEYHHETGKSITGGYVYRGKQLPELEGHYLYTDYITGRMWALKYDETKKRVVANRTLKNNSASIMSYGEDEAGEVYVMTFSPNGKGIHRFVKSASGAK
ncbi:PQQ-dependent sugar dehydrogenase [Zavarzinella formosa]|uniref:PQQ-dependent sugar dehydrogenase n=1 Tax=Zavarzinella formosa TaxID=360055 RepID=UPI0002DCDFFE|nr:PQQ-dependent sugar dehydrogenase [Zavarzinella formosa]